MSKDIDNIIKNVISNNKEIHNLDNHISKDIADLKKSIKSIHSQINELDEKINQILEIMNTFSIVLAEDENEEYDTENHDWTPYDDKNFEEDFEDEDEI
jgi:prefoldin subunit 5